jgi:hypothetical protein
MFTAVLPPREAHVTDYANEPAAGHERVEARFPHAV